MEASKNSNTHKFYNGNIAWMPIFLYKDGDAYNSRKYAVRWLCFLICDGMSFQLGYQFEISPNVVNLRVSIPYVNFYINLPMPRKLDMWAHKNLWRIGARSIFNWQK